MSDVIPGNGQPKPGELPPLVRENIELKNQITFLQNRLTELTPPLPAPKLPTMDMPADPVVPGAAPLSPGGARANCEGFIETSPQPEQSIVPPPPEGKLRIMIGIPMLSVSYEFFESFLKFWTMLLAARDPRYEVCYHFAYRRPVHMAEEYLVKTAQFNKCTHILLMDDDIFDVTPDDLHKLIEANVPFISGVMHASKFPHAMCVFRRYDLTKKVIDMPADNSMYRLYEVPPKCPHCQYNQPSWDVHFCYSCGKEINIEVQECDLTPFPFTLIDLKVFDQIKQPWFHCTSMYPTDSWFCDRLLEAGIKPRAHMTVRLNHAGITDDTKPHFANMGMARMQRNKAVVNLAPDQMEIHQAMLYNKMQAVEASIKPKPPIVGEGNIVKGDKTYNETVANRDLTLVTVGK